MIKMRTMTVVVEPEEAILNPGRILELAVLVPAWQVSALERTAGLEGQTVGQLLRRVIGEFLDASPGGRLDKAPQQVTHVQAEE